MDFQTVARIATVGGASIPVAVNDGSSHGRWGGSSFRASSTRAVTFRQDDAPFDPSGKSGSCLLLAPY